MAFDQKTRNLLQRTITACRRVFDREFTAQLQELYGIQPDGTLTQCEMLDHLADEELEVARLLRSRLNHLEGGEPYEALTRTQAKPENVARVIREQAFTVLNRLAALRLCEERGLVLECVRRGVNSEGFQLFMTTAGNALGETHEAYLVYLHCLFDELALDLGALFDRFSPLALLFPRKDALEAVLRELNGTGKAAENEAISAEQFAEIWKADETIGWIYQYYNDEAERKKMREESSAPRNSRELAVRNQFFTPRYVVEFLTDNALGRLWYEMRHGDTELRDRCAFLVRRPTEIFLNPGEAVPESVAGNEASQKELLRQPVHIPHRPLKDPREIRLLDPACGSMHFGLYAFDLFTVIYDEAWEIAHGQDEEAKSTVIFAPFVTFAASFSDKTAFLLQVPRLIIEHNIHGIDIDPRAAQIAGLSLWLRAQRAWHETGIKPADRPRITRSNIVCAEPMPGEKKLLREFVEEQFEIGERLAFAYLLEKIFDHMALAGEAGSLLRIEDEIRSVIAEAHTLARTQSVPKQVGLFPEEERPEPKQLDLQGLLDEHFWQRAEQRIYNALEAYAEQTENGGEFQRRLFANDAAQGFAFIDLCRKRYDVLLMNPPFGDWSTRYSAQGRKAYPNSYNDILAAFVERGAQLIQPGGRIGAITSRTCFFLSSFTKWRELIVLDLLQPSLLADLGNGVMDTAMVEAAAYVLSRPFSKIDSKTLFCFRVLSQLNPDELLRASVTSVCEGVSKSDIFSVDPASFRHVPTAPFCYWAPRVLIEAFAKHPKAEDIYDARLGMQTNDDEWMVRLWTEIPVNSIDERHWAPYSKGGYYSPFYADLHLVVLWDDGGKTIRAKITAAGDSESRYLRSQDLYGSAGLNWPRRTTSGMSVRPLPQGAIFGEKSPTLFAPAGERIKLLGLMNSRIFAALVSTQIAAATTAARSYEVGIIQRTPIPRNLDSRLADLSLRAWQETIKSDNANEVAHAFVSLSINTSAGLADANRLRIGNQNASSAKLLDIRRQIDGIAYSVYGIYDDDRRAIEKMLSNSPAVEEETEDSADDAESIDYAASANNNSLARFAAETLSYSVGCAFGRWDIRRALNLSPLPTHSDPFAPLPPCSPGMLQNELGLPLSRDDTQRHRSVDGWDYPIEVPWEGILVDDPDNREDIIRRVREILATIWKERADTIEQEACDILKVEDLKEYFRKPTLFFADHLKRYSKSRRQAPIYWPLSTASGRYTLWLYYHRLTPDTLYKCLHQFVVPKLADVEKELTHLRTVLAANEGGAKERSRLEELEALRRELIELRAELELWAPKWKPNLNDGVLITAAPLWKLFRLPKWQKDLKACWKELEKGDYDWSHLAYSLWPDRVREKCKVDRSVAIAHGLEEICEVKALVKKLKKTKKTATKDDLQEYFEG